MVVVNSNFLKQLKQETFLTIKHEQNNTHLILYPLSYPLNPDVIKLQLLKHLKRSNTMCCKLKIKQSLYVTGRADTARSRCVWSKTGPRATPTVRGDCSLPPPPPPPQGLVYILSILHSLFSGDVFLWPTSKKQSLRCFLL